MKSKDQRLLEEAYEQIQLKKGPSATPNQSQEQSTHPTNPLKQMFDWLQKNASQQVRITRGDHDDPPFMRNGFFIKIGDQPELRITSYGDLYDQKTELASLDDVGPEGVAAKLKEILKANNIQVP